MAEVAGTEGGAEKSGAVPDDLAAAALAFLSFSNVCEYLASVSVIADGGSLEYLIMNLDTDKPILESRWHDTLHEVAGILLSGVEQFADAAADLEMRAQAFRESDND